MIINHVLYPFILQTAEMWGWDNLTLFLDMLNISKRTDFDHSVDLLKLLYVGGGRIYLYCYKSYLLNAYIFL